MSMAWLPPGAPLLSCHRAAADPMLPCLTAKRAKSCDAMRYGVIPVRPAIAVLTAARTRHGMRLTRVRWTGQERRDCARR